MVSKVFLIFATAFLLIMLSGLWLIPDKEQQPSDFRALLTAGSIILHGQGAQLYDIATQTHTQQQLFPSGSLENTLLFFNPPFVALLLSPLALLPYTTGYMLIVFINCLLFLWSLFLIMTTISHQYNEKRTIIIYISLLLFAPIYVALMQGQFTFFLLLSLVSGWHSIRKNRPYTAGLWLGILIIKPHLLPIMIMLFVYKKQWKILAGIATTVAIAIVISIVATGFMGLEQYARFLASVPSLGNAYGIYPQIQPTLFGLLHFIASTNALSEIIVPYGIGVSLFLILLLWTWRGKWQPTSTHFAIQWSILVVTILLTSIHTQYYDLTLLLLPLLILLQSIRKDWVFTCLWGCIVFLVMLFFVQPVLLVPCIALLLVILYKNFYSLT